MGGDSDQTSYNSASIALQPVEERELPLWDRLWDRLSSRSDRLESLSHRFFNSLLHAPGFEPIRDCLEPSRDREEAGSLDADNGRRIRFLTVTAR